ncbi:nuclear transport factor 2 family protein [uncultured Shewanella sp.]|uniref:nuclear transport factor 2 family protein n=1 Tax=uncultured Shewanella sp. TaxID=173975 RepID=UPI0026337F71|nr:nuclear transport factor 2 family protein [uncultured Shewanella sp.]
MFKQITHDFNAKYQKIFQHFFYQWVFSEKLTAEQIMDEFFTDDFTAIIDGNLLTRQDFLRRIGKMRAETLIEQQEFLQMMEQENKLFSMHTVKGKMLADDSDFETRAIAYFEFRDDKLHQGYLNSATAGKLHSHDIASRC